MLQQLKDLSFQMVSLMYLADERILSVCAPMLMHLVGAVRLNVSVRHKYFLISEIYFR